MADHLRDATKKMAFISRDEFATHLCDIQYGEAPTGREGEDISYQTGVYAGIDMAYVALMRFPAADVRPVKKGRWIKDSDGLDICSECEEVALQRVFIKLPEKIVDLQMRRSNFCPNCGADMRQTTKGENK